jgi:hypothetical protein
MSKNEFEAIMAKARLIEMSKAKLAKRKAKKYTKLSGKELGAALRELRNEQEEEEQTDG